ncbi:cysteine--tRNA ligase [Microvirga sp. CF3062]|uniref:cysteine--tRNA ligase n=1 Tax=Microvirga sp. CF3062 TaxID=3110182 RepID=UPI002E7717A1|nr:cysteine--tRNA ligase [Microvirga sp. CF3062]MEE1654965.1 cysteine--tRNA ligase [Microvirga sp. CF3062]
MAAKLRLYNTLTRSKDEFVPIDPENVRLYVCGPTVYDYAHIGNARPIIVFDLLFRLLRHVYGKEAVTYVRNITDVDDKINARAARDYPDLTHNEAIRVVTGKTEEQFHADIRALGVLMPEDVNEEGQPPRFVEPRATEHIDEMRMIIERLIARGAAYVAEDHVLFSVSAMQNLSGVPKYGAFSKRSLDELLSGARVDVAPYKRDAMDFVLWKPSGPQDPAWASPAGIATPGRPGWHIECSAMAWRHLVQAFETRLTCSDPTEREIFDIHGGGIDLVFPHHENEIAQSCCAFETPRMANVWMHNGFLQVEGDKMSKSLGNFVTINELLQEWPGEVLRFNMLRTHYRQPIDWTVKGLEESEKTLDRWYELAGRGDAAFLSDHIIAALADDLNTPKMLAELHVLDGQGAHEELGANLRALGFLLEGAEVWKARRQSALSVDPAQVEALIAARKEARASKNWPESDRIRDELSALNVVVKDNKDGTTTWEVAR